jgi:hypothetical protein
MEPGLMWGKALHLHTAGMEEDAQAALDQMRQFLAPKDPNVPAYIAAGKAYFLGKEGALKDRGIIVVGFEGGKRHSVIRAGDVLIARNGFPLATLEDMAKAPKPPEGKTSRTTLLRWNGTRFEQMDVTSQADDPRIALGELRE